MNDSKNSSIGLLVLRYPSVLTQEQTDNLAEAIRPTAEALGVEPLVLGNGADARLEYATQALLERVCVALEEIAQQGRAPEISEAQIAPQALNARPSGLNSRPKMEHGDRSMPARSFVSGGYTGGYTGDSPHG